MSLTEPNIIEKLKPYKLTIIGIGLLALLGIIAGIIGWADGWWFKRGVAKDKQEIVDTAKELANVNAQIGNLLIKQGELKGKIERDTEQLQENIFGLDEAKKETNQAIANLNRALNSNSNVNRSAEDLEEVLRRLDGQN